MFFVFSKILAFLITPIVWVTVLLLYAVIAKNSQKQKKVTLTALIVLFVFSNPFLLDEALRHWEVPAVKRESMPTYDVGIVLSGMINYDHDLKRMQFGRSVDRLLQAVDLYKRKKIRKIFFSGGSGNLNRPDLKEAPLAKEYLLLIGVPEEDIIIETRSRNTAENALFTKQKLDSLNLKGNYLLITSAVHMRRSMACFKKVGLAVKPYSVDRNSGPRKYEPDHLLVPDSGVLSGWKDLFHELIGWMVYKLAGYL